MNKFDKATLVLARASSGNPVISTITVVLFYFFFNLILGQIERLAFGERFEHWLDPAFAVGFMCYAAYAVWMCAALNNGK